MFTSELGFPSPAPAVSNQEAPIETSREEALSRALVNKLVANFAVAGFYGETDGSEWTIGKGRYYKVGLRTQEDVVYDASYSMFHKTELGFGGAQIMVWPVNNGDFFGQPRLTLDSIYRSPDFKPYNLPRVERSVRMERSEKKDGKFISTPLTNEERITLLELLINSSIDTDETNHMWDIYKDDPKYKWAASDENPFAFFNKPVT